MDSETMLPAELDDWEVLKSVLPEGWQEQAKALGAFQRGRKVKDAEALLRLLLIHVAGDCSLRLTALRAEQAGVCEVSDVAVWLRLRGAARWLSWIASELARRRMAALPEGWEQEQRRLCMVDSTALHQPGSEGTDWRLHYVLDFPSLACIDQQVSAATTGESLCLFDFQPGQVALVDRNYGRRAQIAHVVGQGAELVARMGVRALPLLDAGGRTFDLLAHLRLLGPGEAGDWPVRFTHEGRPIAGRVCAIRKSEAAAARERTRIRRVARKKGRRASPEALQAAGYVFVFTNLPDRVPAATVLDLYRARWQVELAFKRLKSLLALSELRKRDPRSAQAWIAAKLVLALLIEEMLGAAEHFSPWGYAVERFAAPHAQPVAGNVAHA
ncbi:MAG TPA: IS4 family transposase [bacterium]